MWLLKKRIWGPHKLTEQWTPMKLEFKCIWHEFRSLHWIFSFPRPSSSHTSMLYCDLNTLSKNKNKKRERKRKKKKPWVFAKCVLPFLFTLFLIFFPSLFLRAISIPLHSYTLKVIFLERVIGLCSLKKIHSCIHIPFLWMHLDLIH